ncbi:MAG: hypothetical protein RL723_588 [Actinomycetota bacterium]|jgi:predicted short-subunit dehydrogenase-like oxidoreductase (DUF2520 family)
MSAAQDGRLNVAVIGAGPVGTVLGQALAAAGHKLLTANSSDPQATVAEADLVLFAIPADQIVNTVSGYAKAGLFKPGQLIAHTAGEFGIGALKPAVEQGVIPLAIHPAMTFTGTSIDLQRIRESYFGVAAPEVALPIAQALVIEMGAEPIVISEEDRKVYFEAISVANNFSKLIVNQSIGLLESIGIEHARVVLGPLIRSAVEEALADGHTPINPEELLS